MPDFLIASPTEASVPYSAAVSMWRYPALEEDVNERCYEGQGTFVDLKSGEKPISCRKCGAEISVTGGGGAESY